MYTCFLYFLDGLLSDTDIITTRDEQKLNRKPKKTEKTALTETEKLKPK